jgi:hypothetical protein
VTKNIFSERTSAHPSEYEFDLAVLGKPTEQFTQHLKGCATCDTQFRELEKDQRSFAASNEPARAARIISGKISERSLWSRLRRFWMIPLATTAAAAAALLLFVRAPVGDGIRTKGGPSIEAFYKRGDEAPRRLPKGMALREGDTVQVGYRAEGHAKVAVFSIEQECASHLELSAPAEEAGLIPKSWTLTGATGSERLYVAFSDASISADEFSKVLRTIPDGCDGHRAPDVNAVAFVARGVALRGERP